MSGMRHVGAVVEEQRGHRLVPVLGGDEERRLAVVVARVDTAFDFALLEEPAHGVHIAREGRTVERHLAVYIVRLDFPAKCGYEYHILLNMTPSP